MLFSNEQTTAQMSHLFEEARQWWGLQKQFVTLQTTEVLTQLFSALALWGILLIVGSMVLLFGSFALAYWLGDLMGSTMLGFGIIALVLLLAVMLVYTNRRNWIVLPITRFMVGLLISSLKVPTQEGISMEKERISQELEENKAELHESASSLLAPASQARNGWEKSANLLQNGITIFRGVQIGLSAVAAFRKIFRLQRRRK